MLKINTTAGAPGSVPKTKRRPSWRFHLIVLSSALALLAQGSCARPESASATLDAGKMATVVIGRSTRADVFAALGQPVQTTQSALGETWIYGEKPDGGGSGKVAGGATAAAGIVGAFVPYVGLLGPSLGLAGLASEAGRADPAVVSLAVSFGDDGIVRDCVYSSTATPGGMPGAPKGTAQLAGCQIPPRAVAAGS